MTNPHRYHLQPYNSMASRHTCPQCQHPKSFTRYIDSQTDRPLGDVVGRCSREHNCGYHYTPKQHFANNPVAGVTNEYVPIDLAKKYVNLAPSHMSLTEVGRSMTNYPDNNLFIWLTDIVGCAEALNLASLYYLGSNDHWHGATVFWQIDAQGKAHTGKIMLYNAQTGKRVKKPYNHIYWMHKKLYAGYYLQQCLFGEHLLPEHPDKPVALVESEKTAIICAHHMPQYLWLATGGLNNLNAATCKVLQGRKVILYPDVNAWQLWQQKAKDLELLLPNTTFKVDDYLERFATDAQRSEGWDLGDLLVG
jgi:rubredoxin